MFTLLLQLLLDNPEISDIRLMKETSDKRRDPRKCKTVIKTYSGDLKLDHSKTVNIQNLDFLKIIFQIVW